MYYRYVNQMITPKGHIYAIKQEFEGCARVRFYIVSKSPLTGLFEIACYSINPYNAVEVMHEYKELIKTLKLKPYGD